MTNWDDVRLFSAVAKTGSLAAAGRALKLSHVTVGRRLEALEEQLGTRLVVRRSRKTDLTAAGQRIASLALDMEALDARIQRTVKEETATLKATVTLTAPPLLASELIAPALPQLYRRHPDLKVVLAASSQLAALDKGDAELAVRLADSVGRGAVARRLGTVHLGLYANRAVAARPQREWSFITYDASLERVPQHRWLVQYAGKRPIVLRSSDAHVQTAAAIAGVGVAPLPVILAERHAELIRVDPTKSPPSRPAWLAIHPDLRKAPAVRAVGDWIVEVFARLRTPQ